MELKITGKVQGVWYRGSTQKEARRLGLRGWVKNEEDGSVTARVAGPELSVRKLIEWCRQGPEMARVDEVLVKQADSATFKDFKIIR